MPLWLYGKANSNFTVPLLLANVLVQITSPSSCHGSIKLIPQIKIQIRRHRAGDLSAQRGGIGVSS